jgi:hypothetical protein
LKKTLQVILVLSLITFIRCNPCGDLGPLYFYTSFNEATAGNGVYDQFLATTIDTIFSTYATIKISFQQHNISALSWGFTAAYACSPEEYNTNAVDSILVFTLDSINGNIAPNASITHLMHFKEGNSSTIELNAWNAPTNQKNHLYQGYLILNELLPYQNTHLRIDVKYLDGTVESKTVEFYLAH